LVSTPDTQLEQVPPPFDAVDNTSAADLNP